MEPNRTYKTYRESYDSSLMYQRRMQQAHSDLFVMFAFNTARVQMSFSCNFSMQLYMDWLSAFNVMS